jgi:hypothetical protein
LAWVRSNPAAGSPFALQKVLTPMMGYPPLSISPCLLSSRSLPRWQPVCSAPSTRPRSTLTACGINAEVVEL